jgi:hypothetical protein
MSTKLIGVFCLGLASVASAQSPEWRVTINPPLPLLAVPDEDFTIPVPRAISSAQMFVPRVGGGAVAFALRKDLRSQNLGVVVWDLVGRKQIGAVETPPGFETTIVLSPSGKKLAAVDVLGDPKKIRVWDVASGQEVATHDPFDNAGYEVFAFLDEDRVLMLPNESGPKPLVWDIGKAADLELRLEGRVSRKLTSADPAGRYLAVGDYTARRIMLTDLNDGSPAGRLDCHAAVPHCQLLFLSFSPDGKRLAAVVNASSTSTFLLWDMTTGNLADKFVLEDNYTKTFCKTRHMEWYPDGRALWLNGNRLVDLEKKAEVFRWEDNRVRLAPRPVTPNRAIYLRHDRRAGDALVIEQLGRSGVTKPTSPAGPAMGPSATVAEESKPAETKAGDRTGCRELTLTDVRPLVGYAPATTAAAEATDWTTDPIPLRGFTLAQPTILFSDAAATKVVVEGCREEGSENDYFRDTRTDFCDRYDLKTGQRDATFEFPAHLHVHIRDLDPSGRYLAARVNTPTGDRAVVYDFDEQRTIADFQPYGGPDDRPKSREGLYQLHLVDAQHVLTGSYDGRATLWKLPECRAVYEITIGVFRGPVLSPGRKTMIVLAERPRRFVMVDVATGRPLGEPAIGAIPDTLRVWAFSYGPDGRNFGFVATQRDGGKATLRSYLWSLTDTSRRTRALLTLPCRDRLLWFGPDRYALVGTGPTEPGAGVDRHLRDIGRPITSQRTSLLDHDAGAVVWHFEMPSGCAATRTIGGRLWYAGGDAAGYHLRSLALPSEAKWKAIVARGKLAPPVQKGDPVGMGVFVADTVPEGQRAVLTDRVTTLLKKRIEQAGFQPAADTARGRLTFSLLFESKDRDEATGVARFLTPAGQILWERRCLFVSKRNPFDSGFRRDPQPIPTHDPLAAVCTWLERHVTIPDTFVGFAARQRGMGITRLSGDSVAHQAF